MTRPTLVAALPWNLADMMSVQAASLKAFLTSKGVPALGRHYYATVDRFLSGEEIDIIHARFLGDHLYAMLLFPENAAAVGARIRERSQEKIDPWDCAARLAAYTQEVAADVASTNAALVGFTTTHMQYLASVATAKAVKALLPDVRVVLGGLALHGEPAADTLSLFPWIDYVIVGEGETALWRLSQHVAGERDVEDVPQLVYRGAGAVRISPHVETIADLDTLPLPDYSDYFVQVQRKAVPVTPRATIEMVRGCRWGRCSFCIEGLPSRGGFRTKSPARVAREIERCVEEHYILDFVTSDPDVAFNARIFEEIGRLGFDLRFMVEMSGLVSLGDFHTMLDAGVRTVQIGIESFSPKLLKTYNKGVTLAKYVELLRSCADRDVQLVYNNIYRAPFETQEDLDEAVENMQRLMFFQPPRLSEFRVSVGSRIIAEPERYAIKRLLPSEEVIGYPAEVAERVGMLVSFNAGYGYEPVEHAGQLDYEPYLNTLRSWEKVWAMRPKKVARRGHGFIRVDHRIGNERFHLLITDPLEIALFEYCQTLRSRRDIQARFSDTAPAEVDVALDRLWTKHLVFVTPRECVALATLRPSVLAARGEDSVVATAGGVQFAS